MNFLKKHSYIYKFILFILIITTIQTFINLIFPINKKTNQLISLIIILIYSLFSGIKKGLRSNEKAYLQGLKLGSINILILYILSIITLDFRITIKRILYYLIIIGITILGSIIGINKKGTN